MLLFLGTSGWRIWAGQMEEDQSEVELQVGIRRNTDESSSLTGWRPRLSPDAPHLGTHPATNRGTGSPPLTPAAPEAVSCPTNQPPQNKTKPTRGSPAVPMAPRPPARPLRAPLRHFAPPAGTPKRGRGRGAGAGKRRDENVKSLTNSS